MKKKAMIFVVVVFTAVVVYFFLHEKKIEPANLNFEKEGLVFNEDCAVKIAEAIWLPIYGSEIYTHKPFKAKLNNNVWTVNGTVHEKYGGAPYIEINKSDGKILKVTHYK